MPLFDSTIPVNHEEVAKIVKQFWNIELGKVTKASQNHTFEGIRIVEEGKSQKFAIRVTPDHLKASRQRIQDQITFVNYLSKHKLNRICAPVPKSTSAQQFIYEDQKFVIVVFQWANGQMLNFVQFQWMKNKKVVYAWGVFFAELHNLSKQFQKQHSEVAKRIQKWNQIHHGILKDVKLDQRDQKDVQNPEHYGTLHGDLNCSNFFYDRLQNVLNVYDTDQVQRGFYLWDLSQGIFTSYMLQHAGMPCSGTPVPQANRKQFQQWIVEGYESVAGKGWIDLQRLQRMILLKRLFYAKFCTQAVAEGNIPADMKAFVEYIANTLGKML